MTDYRKYSCNRMLQYIEKRSAELEVNNHIDYILSMENENSIEDIIKIYNHAYQFLAILFLELKKYPSDGINLKHGDIETRIWWKI